VQLYGESAFPLGRFKKFKSKIVTSIEEDYPLSETFKIDLRETGSKLFTKK